MDFAHGLFEKLDADRSGFVDALEYGRFIQELTRDIQNPEDRDRAV